MKIVINTWEENIYEIPDEKLDDELLEEGSDCEIAEYFMEHGKKLGCVDSGYTNNEPYRVIREEESK